MVEGGIVKNVYPARSELLWAVFSIPAGWRGGGWSNFALPALSRALTRGDASSGRQLRSNLYQEMMIRKLGTRNFYIISSDQSQQS